MRAAILGAGVIGVSTAWYLKDLGWDEHGDALLFTQQLAYYCKMRGVRFHHGVNITKLVRLDGRIEIAMGCTNDGLAVFIMSFA